MTKTRFADHPDFPIENLPHGVFSIDGGAPRGGMAIGDWILDMKAAIAAGALSGAAAMAASEAPLNRFLAMGQAARLDVRAQVTALLTGASPTEFLHEAARCTLHLPCAIGDYTDFYAGIQHAVNVGRLLRPDAPLMANYKYLPVGYHGRASSVRPSGIDVRRPQGQRKPGSQTVPSYGPSRNLDYELELGVWIGPGNDLGTPIPIGEATDHIAGFCLLNDWSARDIQGWEYQPLGPFLAKSFQTSVSPWIVTPEALAPFRIPQPARPEADPALLPHLHDATDQDSGAFDIELEVLLQTATMPTPHRLSIGNARHLYWTVAQMVAHHASAGCNLQPGDLLGTGTISAPERTGWGSLLELSMGGREPLALPNGETRRFLEDGDTIILRARASRPGLSIGFGECRATILPVL